MEDIDAIKGLGDQAPTETKPLRRPSLYGDQAPTLSISITFFENWYKKLSGFCR
jgi:hypothetical protein